MKKLQIAYLFIFVSLVITNLITSNNKLNPNFSLSDVININQAHAESGVGCSGGTAIYCYNGGCGSSSCSIDAGISILGCGVTTGGSVTASSDNYFACCTLRCKSYLKSQYYESQNVSDTDLP